VTQAEPLIRNISDTALLAAVYRARETERQDALFRDPLARRPSRSYPRIQTKIPNIVICDNIVITWRAICWQRFGV